ncbi:hypothetical protein [Leptospira brenneri]|uniref:hypothetical protein n=1 Tax=Leptospira brenneri TaxID=2023182 RepID=UPI000C2960F4|nr:hypothetical protein [Leptospira brenneri]PJZ45507.1 hypothetical protein CH361_10805 [Leptospira brenneri]
MTKQGYSFYPQEYNKVLSDVFEELKGNFAALASPTLSKQETVTHLFESISKEASSSLPHRSLLWLRIIQFPIRLMLMFVRILYITLRFRTKFIPRNAVVFRTWLVPKSFKNGELVDDYFRELPIDLSAYKNVVIYYSGTDLNLWRRFGKVKRSNIQICSYSILSLLDVIKLVLNFFFTGLIQVKKTYSLNGIDITKSINRSLLLDYLLLRSFEAYIEKYKCKKLAELSIDTFVYIFENQSWEKICCHELKKHHVQMIGYQSSGFSPIFLNFFPTQKDSELHPMPDILLTVGEHFKKYLLENGHYSIPVEVFSALRFKYKTEGDKFEVKTPNPTKLKRILYAFPVQLEQYQATVSDLINVFGDSDIYVDLKFHPLYMQTDLRMVDSLPLNFKAVFELDMNLLRDTYDCVLFNDNSFGIESLMQGVRAYQYNRDGNFFDERFFYFDLWQTNITYQDLADLKYKIQTSKFEKSFDVSAVSEYVNAMYRPYSLESLNRFKQLLSLV